MAKFIETDIKLSLLLLFEKFPFVQGNIHF